MNETDREAGPGRALIRMPTACPGGRRLSSVVLMMNH